jgi:hypothetical protein
LVKVKKQSKHRTETLTVPVTPKAVAETLLLVLHAAQLKKLAACRTGRRCRNSTRSPTCPEPKYELLYQRWVVKKTAREFG